MNSIEQHRLPKRKIYRLIGTFCLILIIIGFGYFAFYKYQQSKIHIQEPIGFPIQYEEAGGLTQEVGAKWLESYTQQYQQKYLQQSKKLKAYTIDKTIVLENEANKVLQIDFTIIPQIANDKTTYLWKGAAAGTQIRCQWVLWFNKEIAADGTIVYKVTKLQSPAAYDLEKYNTSPEKSKDEYDREFVNEIPYKKEQYTYKIQNKKCSVSYDGGTTWKEVPLDLETLVNIGDGNTIYNKLQEGSYLITPEKTVFIYGGTSKKGLSCIYSEDKGETWHTAEISREINGVRVKFCSFPNVKVGYVISTAGRTMSQEEQIIFKTIDGGANWQAVGGGPRTNLLQNSGFISEPVGFITYPVIGGAEPNFYRTEDGGKTFQPILLPVVKEEWMGSTFEPFIQPETPYLENGKLFVLVGQGPQGDFKGGRIMAKYQSEDMGRTWTFIEIVDPPVQSIG